MEHDSLITIPWILERTAAPLEETDKYPEGLVRHFLNRYTRPGDKVLDPFAGLGTTLFVAEEMNRRPFGVEADRTRYEWVAGQLERWDSLIHGDAGDVADLGCPKMDFCMTSPPYMPSHHKWNPLFGGDPVRAGYAVYLARMAEIFAGVRRVMKKNAYLAVQADNLPRKGGCTPLVHDMTRAVSQSFRFETETIVVWERPKPDYTHTHVLIFKTV